MSGYSHLTAEDRDRLADLKADGLSLREIARALGRAASTISRELRRNVLDSGAYRPLVADGSYIQRRQRAAVLETDAGVSAYVTDRLAEGWTPEQIAGRLRLGIERGLRAVCAETIYGWIYRAAQKPWRLWRFLTPHHARRRKRHGRASKDKITEKPTFPGGLTTLTLA
jgi:IS30 family transposase